MFAVLCVVGILISREPILVRHPFRVAMFGLGPIIVFFLVYVVVSLWILFRIFPWCKKKKEETVASFDDVNEIVTLVKKAMAQNKK